MIVPYTDKDVIAFNTGVLSCRHSTSMNKAQIYAYNVTFLVVKMTIKSFHF